MAAIDQQILDKIEKFIKTQDYEDNIVIFNIKLAELAGYVFATILKQKQEAQKAAEDGYKISSLTLEKSSFLPEIVIPDEMENGIGSQERIREHVYPEKRKYLASDEMVYEIVEIEIVSGPFNSLIETLKLKFSKREITEEFCGSYSWLITVIKGGNPDDYSNYYPLIYYNTNEFDKISETWNPELVPYHLTACVFHELSHVIFHWDDFLDEIKKGNHLSIKADKSPEEGREMELDAWRGAKQLFGVLLKSRKITRLTDEIHDTVTKHIFEVGEAEDTKGRKVDDTPVPSPHCTELLYSEVPDRASESEAV